MTINRFPSWTETYIYVFLTERHMCLAWAFQMSLAQHFPLVFDNFFMAN